MALRLIIKYTLMEALKRRLWALFLFIMLASFSIGLSSRSLAVIEGDLALFGFYAAFVRVGSVLMIGFYLIATEIKTFEDARIQLTLALPMSRADLLFGKLLAYFIISLIMVISVTLPLLLYVDSISVFAWGLSMLCEMLIVSAAALLLALIFKHPVFGISFYIIFYVFSRSAAEFQLHASNVLMQASDQWLPWILKIITYLVPKLDRFANARWLMYGIENLTVLSNVLLQTIIFLPLLIIAAFHNIRHKEF